MDILQALKKQIPLVLKGIVISVIAYIFLRILKIIIRNILNKTKLDKTIVKFLLQLINPLLYLFYFYTMLLSFSIPVGGITGLIASIGLSLSLALKDTLSDIANGITILISKPFKVGDYIEINEFDGTVDVIGLMLTELVTPDKRKIYIPNSTVSNSTVINYTVLDIRRLEMEFCTSFMDDIDKAKDVILKTVLKNKLVINTIKPIIFVDKIDTYSLKYSVRVYCKTNDYWDLKWQMSEIIFKSFKENNISVPYQQIGIIVK